jgi:hypothetical protein
MWKDINDVTEFHEVINQVDLLHEKGLGKYREPTSSWGALSGKTKLKDDNPFNNRKWLYTVWRSKQHKGWVVKVSSLPSIA